MADSSESYAKKYWKGYKEFWGERFSWLENYYRFVRLDKPLPPWSTADVQDFIASDLVHGPALQSAREAAKFGLTGSFVGALSTAGLAWKYSKSLHGAGLSFVAGGVFGWTFGHEIANHWLQLYRLDTIAAQTGFMQWWESKCREQS